MLSHVWLVVTPSTIAHQAPLSMGFSRQDYWSGSFSRGSSQPSNQTSISCIFCVGRWILYHSAIWTIQRKKLLYFFKTFYISERGLRSVQFSHSVMSRSLRSHELQHARPPYPTPTPGVHPNSCPSSWWCHPAISSSVVPFSSCPQSLPASEFRNMQMISHLFKINWLKTQPFFISKIILEGKIMWNFLELLRLNMSINNYIDRRHKKVYVAMIRPWIKYIREIMGTS